MKENEKIGFTMGVQLHATNWGQRQLRIIEILRIQKLSQFKNVREPWPPLIYAYELYALRIW